MSKYSELDEQIVVAISNGCDTYGQLCNRFRDATEKFSTDAPWRVMDRRLQAIRKKGLIAYQRGVWYKNNVTTEA